MTPNSSPVRSVDRPARKSLWIPRSRTAAGVLALIAVIAVGAAVLVAANAYLIYPGCFDECGDPLEAGRLAAVAIAVALWPFAAVRLYQGRWPATGPARLAVVVALTLVIAGAALRFVDWW